MSEKKRIVSKEHVKKERNPQKLKKAMQKKGYASGKAPEGKEIHHKEPISQGGKTVPKNLQVVTKEEHQKIHKKRRQQGKNV